MTRAARRDCLAAVLLVCLTAQLLAPAAAAMPCGSMATSTDHAAMAQMPEQHSAMSRVSAPDHSAHEMTATLEPSNAAMPASADCCDGSGPCVLGCIAPVGICTTGSLLAERRESPDRSDAIIHRSGAHPQRLYRPPIPA